MMNRMIKRITNFMKRFVAISDREHMGTFSLLVVLVLDIFILSVLFIGLDDHTAQLTSPYEYVPSLYRNVFIDMTWSEANRLDKLQSIVLEDSNRFVPEYEQTYKASRIDRMHPLCRKFYRSITTILQEEALKNLFVKRDMLLTKKQHLDHAFNKAKNVYDTKLLEDVVDKTQLAARQSPEIKKYLGKIKGLQKEIRSIDSQINTAHAVRMLWKMLEIEGNQERDALMKDIARFEFWYPLKVLAWQFLFLFPLLLFFYIWNARSLKRNKYIQVLISSHLLVITLIPVLLKFFDVVMELIPRHFFKRMFQLLELLHLIALWHYFVIALLVAISVFVMYLIQKKVRNSQGLRLKRAVKGLCHSCGKKLPHLARHCPVCGAGQFHTCIHCHQDTYLHGTFCHLCGKKQ